MTANPHLSTRRRALAAMAFTMAPTGVLAQGAWPERPIKLIVPFAPGGSNDNIARVVANQLGARLGQSIVIDNRGGAGGTIGTDFAIKSPPDGYTLLLVSSSITTNAAVKKLNYDPMKDLALIGGIAAGPLVVVVGSGVKAHTLPEFLALAKANPKGISYGSAGVGGISHLGTELLASAAHVQMTHVPYKGINPAFTDLMGGNLQMILPSLASATPYIRRGQMRALAVTSAERSELAPDLPTVAEFGMPSVRVEVSWGLAAPSRVPPPLLKRLNTELNAILAQPEVKDILAREGATPQPGSPEKFGKAIHDDFALWTRLVKDANIEAE